MRPATLAKAAGLQRDGRVTHLPDARVYAVEGETGIYAVTVIGEVATCTCPAVLACAHRTAALQQHALLDEHLAVAA